MVGFCFLLLFRRPRLVSARMAGVLQRAAGPAQLVRMLYDIRGLAFTRQHCRFMGNRAASRTRGAAVGV